MKQCMIIKLLLLSGMFLLKMNKAQAQIFEKDEEQQQTENLAFLPENEDPLHVPIDGGLGVLLAAGLGYGLKKVNDKRREKKR